MKDSNPIPETASSSFRLAADGLTWMSTEELGELLGRIASELESRQCGLASTPLVDVSPLHGRRASDVLDDSNVGSLSSFFDDSGPASSEP